MRPASRSAWKNRRSQTGSLGIERIDSTDDYIRLAAQLERISVVKRVVPIRATADSLEADLELSTGLAGFRRLLDKSVLVAADLPPADPDALNIGLPSDKPPAAAKAPAKKAAGKAG